MPGSARQIIDAHLAKERASAEALTRLTKAESTGVRWGAVGAQLITFGGLIAGVVLILMDKGGAAIIGFMPAILGGSAQVISAVRRKGD
ncbi:hypothetical protein [Microbacterium sp. KR10-403]|uniref:hypothetical protein n=1 Tax=Microbacterium sp. KR10-403 TaxID=3158581 RepID=UPI0032E46C05